MSTHTPGPWTAHDNTVAGQWPVSAKHGPGRANITCVSSEDVCRDEARANARLIAEAPNMLEALKNVTFALAWHCREGAGPKAMDEKFLAEARAAIAKAEGT